jgi:hypothetical protein
MELVPLRISLTFGVPIIDVGCWGAGSMATSVIVPKASVNEDDLPARGKDEIGFSGKRGYMQGVSIA